MKVGRIVPWGMGVDVFTPLQRGEKREREEREKRDKRERNSASRCSRQAFFILKTREPSPSIPLSFGPIVFLSISSSR
jgi:hypothetical protein